MPLQLVLAGLSAAEHELRSANRPAWIADAVAAARELIQPTERPAQQEN